MFAPIRRNEIAQFMYLSFLMFCILFNQNLLRILKDSILIPEIGAEVINFIKVYCVMPAAAIFLILYTKMVNSLSFYKIYLYLIIFFVGYFIIFAFFLYPNTEFIHISKLSYEQLKTQYPNFKWYVAIIGHWSFVIFYVLSEMWPNTFYLLLFWQFANSINSTDQAQRFYTLFSLFGNTSLIFVGLIIINFASDRSIIKNYFIQKDNKELFIQSSISLVAIISVISVVMVKRMSSRFVYSEDHLKDLSLKKTRPKLGLKESLKYIISSSYLWLLLICSASFGLCMNLIESVWKSKVRELHQTVNSYAEFGGTYILLTGITIIIMTIIGNNLMRYFSWIVSAILAPIVILIVGSIFFILVVFSDMNLSFIEHMALLGPLHLAVLVGAVQNIIAKGIKYSIWDTAREMLYIPLDTELKTKGKAAVDVVSSKVGKAMSSLIQSVTFTIIPSATYSSISHILMIIFIIVCFTWIAAIKKIYEYYKITLLKNDNSSC